MTIRTRPIFCHILILLLILGLTRAVDEANDKAEEEESNEIDDKEGQETTVDVSHGFGANIDWVAWPEAISRALDLDKPIFLLIHKTWCGACQQLQKSFTTSTKRKDLVELSKKFVMVNTEDDEEPKEDDYAPDGRYIPRLFFLNKFGERMPIDNAKNFPKTAAYFPQLPDVLKAMKQALKAYGVESEGSEGEKKAEKELVSPPSKKKEKDETAEKESAGKEKKKQAKKENAKDKKVEEKESYKNANKEKEGAEAVDSKGGCPHAAGKAAAKAKAEEEAKAKKAKEAENAENKETGKKTEKTKEQKKNEQTKEKKAKDPKKEETKKKEKTKKTEL